ncbi:CRP-like cAMP-binding protein [Catalinimonas alkaloidigena]|uniref:Crp/Fnr family transcriptional regulator n=1 Tax=Catalinimonas alkaloidigena TaxID=1075417 RepID=UPI0024051352|nr:cyclic nucleotide-binding domain-containing protein [Catalinimonas alkaloidigena]MDF9796536.1 CRP-like cAMP-binding protein [Catalinimonas alkaloidigena]
MIQKHINALMSTFLSEKQPQHFYQNFSHFPNLKIFAKNDVIFREGEEARSSFLLCKGEVFIVKQKQGDQYRLIETLNSREILGLPPILSNDAYTSTAIVKSKAYTFKVLKEELTQFLAEYPMYHLKLAKCLSKKILHYERMIVS